MATGMFEKLVGYGLGFIAVVLIILVLIGKTGLIPQAAKAALGLGNWAMPDKPNPNVQPDESLPQETTAAQERFMNEIIKFPDKSLCTLKFSSLNGLGDQTLELLNHENGIQSRIGKIAGDERTGRIYLNRKETSQKNLQICTIDAEKFYNCCLENLNENCCKAAYKTTDTSTLTSEGISINQKVYSLENGLLFKPEANKVCFIPEHKNGEYMYSFINPLNWGCDTGDISIDNDCIKKISLRQCQ